MFAYRKHFRVIWEYKLKKTPADLLHCWPLFQSSSLKMEMSQRGTTAPVNMMLFLIHAHTWNNNL